MRSLVVQTFQESEGRSMHLLRPASPRSRLLAVLGVWQFAVIVIGQLFTTLLLRQSERWEVVVPYYLEHAPILTSLSYLVRVGGFALLWLPLVWLVVVAVKSDGARELRLELPFRSGLALAVSLTALYALAAAHAFEMGFCPIIE